MKASSIKLAGFLFFALSGVVFGQSRDQNFPTAITSSEINGVVKARDLGDSRLTSYYYAFEGSQGDIFINVVTKNFAGDIDVFTQDGLKTLTKVVIFADSGLSETGRLIYLRKPEKLLLRIQGRTPNDDAATYRIKFGGSFIAIKGNKEEAEPTIERDAEQSKTVVNSVGTIVEITPKPLPAKETPVRVEKESEVKKSDTASKTVVAKEKEILAPARTKPEVVVSSTIKEPAETKTEIPAKPVDTRKASVKSEKSAAREEKKADPLESIRLVIQMKDGTVVARPMKDVLRFSVDKGVLTVVSKRGAVSKYSILDVAKVTFE
ncbi:MAG: hypothetical protein ABL999_11875 [Pyrinomonadaceae bacterium]